MNAESLRKIQKEKPFRPMILHLSDGQTLEVPHPEFMLVAPSGRLAVIIYPDDTIHHIDLIHITDVEFRSPSDNGRSH